MPCRPAGLPACTRSPSAGPAAGEGGGGVKGALKEAWHGLKEITPGTKVC